MPPERMLRRARPLRAIVVGLAASLVVAAWIGGGERPAMSPLRGTEGPPVNVRYEVASPVVGATARVTYQSSCGDTVTTSNTPLPWTATLTVQPGALASVSAELEGEGKIDVRLLVNHDRVRTDSAQGHRPVAEVSDES